MIKLFFSYSHRNEDIRDELETHLAMLKRQGIVEAWHDRRIGAGEEVHDEISEHLETADVVLLLVSPYFLASDYCYEREMTRAVARHDEGTCRVIPVIVDPCEWHQTPFGTLRATPTDGKPISKYANVHEAFLEVTRDIRSAAEAFSRGTETIRQPRTPVLRPAIREARSSNLRVKKVFSDRDRDDFREEAFRYVANFFESSLVELADRNPGIEVRYRPNGDRNFNASVYSHGEKKVECRISFDPEGSLGELTYTANPDQFMTGVNESMSVDTDGYMLGLRPLGLASLGSRSRDFLTPQGAAEYFWTMFVSPLQ